MKNWYKILVFVVLGAFVFPNIAKVLHNCEATHHHCDHDHEHEKPENGLSSSLNHFEGHNCYICNFHYAGFEVKDQFLLKLHINNYKEEYALRLLRGYSSNKLSSNRHRGPPHNLFNFTSIA